MTEIDEVVRGIIACPEDFGPLLYFAAEDGLYNPRLRRRYSVREGIAVLLVDQAEAVDGDEHARLMAKAEREGIRPNFRDP